MATKLSKMRQHHASFWPVPAMAAPDGLAALIADPCAFVSASAHVDASALVGAGASAGAGCAADTADDFASIAQSIAHAKCQLDVIQPHEYEALARELDLYQDLKRRLRTEYGVPVVTNAMLKLYELLSQQELPLVPAGPVRAFCNAELPGAFVIALNQYMRGVRPECEFEWLASSYVPDAANGALDDKYGLYAKNRDRWLMRAAALDGGATALDGDLTDSAVVAALASAVRKRFGAGATLYTSDAGIDVSADYNQQEAATAVLNFGQVVCGLLSLAVGGTLITKQYTWLTSFNRQLLMLLSALFEQLHLVKPVTSRPANSEVYVVGTGFLGIDAAASRKLLALLASFRGRPDAASACNILAAGPEAAPDVDRALLRTAREFAAMQIRYLNEIATVYATMYAAAMAVRGSTGISAVHSFARQASRDAISEWLRSYPVHRLAARDQLRLNMRGKK